VTVRVSPQLEAIALAAAERRVRRDVDQFRSRRKRQPARVLVAAGLLFAASFALRLVIDDPGR
jgi:hypothetical protein